MDETSAEGDEEEATSAGPIHKLLASTGDSAVRLLVTCSNDQFLFPVVVSQGIAGGSTQRTQLGMVKVAKDKCLIKTLQGDGEGSFGLIATPMYVYNACI